jgi:uncharacterized protein (TIGR02186 family)
VIRRLIGLVALWISMMSPAHSEPLIADLSEHLVAITTGFTGAEVLLFGAIEGEGDLVVVVSGPPQTAEVRRKESVVGIWLNNAQVSFENAPAYYQILATREIGDWLPQTIRERHKIGVEFLRLTPSGDLSPEESKAFTAAFIRNKERMGHYRFTEGKITKLGGRLFRANVFFPANVPTGTYKVEVFLIREGAVESAQTTPLYVSQIGIGADIYQFAHEYSASYGITAILIAIFAGLGAAFAFRRT